MRLLDAIPFSKSLHHDMEIWNWEDTHVDYAVGSFWYARPGATSNREPQPAEAAAPLHAPPPDTPRKVSGRQIECEMMKIVEQSPGLAIDKQDVSTFDSGHWSGGEQLFAQSSQPGGFLTLEIPVDDSRPRKLILRATKSYDYGILRFTVNGKPAGSDYDGYAVKPTDSGPIDLGTVEPKDGKLLLRAEIVGTNPKSTGARYFFWIGLRHS